MSFNNTITPSRLPRVVGQPLQPIRKEVIEVQLGKRAKQNVIWGSVNLILLAIVTNDILASHDKCNKYHTYFYYFEHILVVIFLLNTLYHLYKYCTIHSKPKEKKAASSVLNQGINNVTLNTSLNTSNTDAYKSAYQNVYTSRFSKTPMDTSTASWLSNSGNQSLNTTPWSFQAESPTANSPGFKSSPILPANLSTMALVDEHSLSQYLKEYETIETSQNVNVEPPTTNSLSFFWNHPATKIKDNSPLLRRCQYQLSTPSPPHSSSPKTDDKSSPMNQSQCSDTWKRLNVDSVALTQWTENLRVWISQTILCRLITEFETIDKSLHMQGLTDISIGKVGLDRLRKTAQGLVLQNTPNLPTVVPFLELHSNQEYLVQRIRDLSKGGCMSEYKWHGGGFYNEKEWDATLPTDAAIVMHLTAEYLNTQLIPLPNNPDVKPFTGFHFIKSTDKLPEAAASTLAIHEVSVKPPHYRIIIGTESYEIAKGYNNLFHSILFFLYHVNKREHGMLGRMNLGRSGLNMLWIINAN